MTDNSGLDMADLIESMELIREVASTQKNVITLKELYMFLGVEKLSQPVLKTTCDYLEIYGVHVDGYDYNPDTSEFAKALKDELNKEMTDEIEEVGTIEKNGNSDKNKNTYKSGETVKIRKAKEYDLSEKIFGKLEPKKQKPKVGKNTEKYIEQLNKLEGLSPDDPYADELVFRLLKGDTDAANKLTEALLPAVVVIADDIDYSKCKESPEDIISEGNLALVSAIHALINTTGLIIGNSKTDNIEIDSFASLENYVLPIIKQTIEEYVSIS